MNIENLNKTAHKILDAAEHYTQTQGFNDFSYKDLQRDVGVKTSTIHYYFPTKQDLAVTLVTRHIQNFLHKLQLLDATQTTGMDKLTGIGEIFLHVAQDNKFCLCGMLTSDMLSLPQEGVSELRRFYSEVESWIVKAIQQSQQEGQTPAMDAEQSAAHYLATLEGGLLIARARKDQAYMQSILNQALLFFKNQQV
ncbi:TetR/AcrR family transcriptional regulator [Marinicella sp. W31]|uniref:TetR/AcrR family transcriptional regulator n=1 Tax=Marinicella sp. W31 TaxID=3023713 RepID=UPI003757CD6A